MDASGTQGTRDRAREDDRDYEDLPMLVQERVSGPDLRVWHPSPRKVRERRQGPSMHSLWAHHMRAPTPKTGDATSTLVRLVRAEIELQAFIDSLVLPLPFSTTENWHQCPNTLDELRACCATGMLWIWSGASDRTVYGSPARNHKARAWHDLTHVLLSAETDAEGELRTACMQHKRARARGMSIDAANLLWADTEGMQEYRRHHGYFPTDQRAFCWHHWALGDIAVEF